MEIGEREKAHCIRRIIKSRIRVLSENGFLGLLLMHMKFALDNEVGTAGTDGERMYFDPEFLKNLSDDELDFIMKHEIMHVVLRHATRRGQRDRALFNIAADIVVNSNIMQQAGGDPDVITLADGGVSIHRVPDGREGYLFTTEEVCGMLLGSMEIRPDAEGLADDHSRWGSGNADALDEVWKTRIRDAYEASKGRGSAMSDGIERELKRYLYPRTDWRTVLHDFIQEEVTDYSFTPPDKRFSELPFFLPAFNYTEESIKDVLFFIDTSSSMDDEEVSELYYEIKAAIDQFGDRLTGWLGFFDTDVRKPERFSGSRGFRMIRPFGGGGTSFNVIFDYISSEMEDAEISCIIILTDGLATFPPEQAARGIPVLWIINNDFVDPPWGRVVRV